MTFSARHISYSYRDRQVLSDVSLTVDSSQLMTVMGPNGVGKTTLLKSIVGILHGGIGELTVDGEDITGKTPRERARIISYVPQRSHQSGSTVFESVLLGRRPYLTWDVTEEDLDTVSDMISMIGLEDLSEKKVDAISMNNFIKTYNCPFAYRISGKNLKRFPAEVDDFSAVPDFSFTARLLS